MSFSDWLLQGVPSHQIKQLYNQQLNLINTQCSVLLQEPQPPAPGLNQPELTPQAQARSGHYTETLSFVKLLNVLLEASQGALPHQGASCVHFTRFVRCQVLGQLARRHHRRGTWVVAHVNWGESKGQASSASADEVSRQSWVLRKLLGVQALYKHRGSSRWHAGAALHGSGVNREGASRPCLVTHMLLVQLEVLGRVQSCVRPSNQM